MNQHDIVQRLQRLELPKEDYWLVTGSAMVMYGIKDQTCDIDMGCSKKLADRLEADGYLSGRTADGCRKFAIGADIEVFEEWLFDQVESVDGIPIISLKGLVMMKESLGREKDLADIQTIKKFVEQQGKG